MTSATEVLTEVLYTRCALETDEDVVDYLAATLDGIGEDEDEVVETLSELLLAQELAEDEECAAAMCKDIFQRMYGSSSAGAGAAADEKPMVLLSAPMVIGKKSQAQEEAIGEMMNNAISLKRSDNATIKYGNKMLGDFDDSPEAMIERARKEKKQDRNLKRSSRNEKRNAMQTDEFLASLARKPVVRHWAGGRKSSNNDMILKRLDMNMGGKQLLDDCDVTLVFGRRYGLIGHNGVGKTTFLKVHWTKHY